jgi:hypothetical protein
MRSAYPTVTVTRGRSTGSGCSATRSRSAVAWRGKLPHAALAWPVRGRARCRLCPGLDVAGKHALVLMTGRRGDLSRVVAVASGLGGVPRAERVTGELVWVEAAGRAGTFLDDQRDGLSRERSGHGTGAGHAPKDRTGGDRGGIEPVLDTGEAARHTRPAVPGRGRSGRSLSGRYGSGSRPGRGRGPRR